MSSLRGTRGVRWKSWRDQRRDRYATCMCATLHDGRPDADHRGGGRPRPRVRVASQPKPRCFDPMLARADPDRCSRRGSSSDESPCTAGPKAVLAPAPALVRRCSQGRGHAILASNPCESRRRGEPFRIAQRASPVVGRSSRSPPSRLPGQASTSRATPGHVFGRPTYRISDLDRFHA